MRHLGLLYLVGTLPWLPAQSPPGPDGELEQRLSALLQSSLQEDTFEGLSAVVAIGSDILVSDGYGYADRPKRTKAGPESVYRVGSLTEQFQALALVAWCQENELDLEDSLEEVLPELSLASSISIRGLLSHTSGLPGYTDLLEGGPEDVEFPRTRVLAWLGETGFASEPGSCFAYSNTNVFLSGMVLEKLTDRPLPDYLSEHVFEELGMSDTEYCFRGPSLPKGDRTLREIRGDVLDEGAIPQPFEARGLCSTALDVFRWSQPLFQGDLLDSEILDEVLSPGVLKDGTGTAWGMGVGITSTAGHRGYVFGGGMGGSRVHVAYYPAGDLSIVLLAQGERAPLTTIEKRLTRAVLDVPQEKVLDLALEAEQRSIYLGEYYVGCNQVTLFEKGEQLFVSNALQRVSRLMAQGGHVFLAENDPEVRYRFEVEDGSATGFVLEEHGIQSIGKRIMQENG